uniref:UPF0329 protein ECU05_1680/ECU11_0050-like n=1 Tax=Rhizophora mucronata TaxID=61149 RepID=A0A2P2KJ62_RHIMU
MTFKSFQGSSNFPSTSLTMHVNLENNHWGFFFLVFFLFLFFFLLLLGFFFLFFFFVLFTHDALTSLLHELYGQLFLVMQTMSSFLLVLCPLSVELSGGGGGPFK